MNIRIYQINTDRDVNRVLFTGLEMLEAITGSRRIDPEIYDTVWHGEVECKTLEEAFRKFNLHWPEGYAGRSLSVSDVVEIVEPGGKSTFWFCDSYGFKKIKFKKEDKDV